MDLMCACTSASKFSQVWRGAPGNGSVVSGGVRVTGWTPTTLGGRAAFVAPVPSAARASGPSGVIRQLWVRGTREFETSCVRDLMTMTPHFPCNLGVTVALNVAAALIKVSYQCSSTKM